jgi:beta-phosphoglucomutase-like phosphatase (HAD superfamily)
VLELPINTKAVLWDMDGVLIDSLLFDQIVCSDIASKYLRKTVEIPYEVIRANFALAHKEFWQEILKSLNLIVSTKKIDEILSEYDIARKTYSYSLHRNVIENLRTFSSKGIKQAVVSSNTEYLISSILQHLKIDLYFNLIVGFDTKSPFSPSVSLNKKPSPDMYNAAIKLLSVNASQCVVVEDSVVGAKAGLKANAYVIGVATGANTVSELKMIISEGKGVVVEEL